MKLESDARVSSHSTTEAGENIRKLPALLNLPLQMPLLVHQVLQLQVRRIDCCSYLGSDFTLAVGRSVGTSVDRSKFSYEGSGLVLLSLCRVRVDGKLSEGV